MAKVSPEVSEIVEKAFERYVQEVEESNLSEESKKTYIEHSSTFVRWLNDDFEPGAQVRRVPPIVPPRPPIDPRYPR